MSEAAAMADWQARFAEALLDHGRPPPPGLLAPGGPEEVSRRFAVHRNNVVGGLVRALAERFPVVRRLVGEAFFNAMARHHVIAHPPDSPIMARFGGAFPGFIAAFPPAASLPYLADLARLEAALGRACHAADIEPLTHAAFSALGPSCLERCRIVLHPSVQVVLSQHPIVSLWHTHQSADEPQALSHWQAECALVSRPAGEVALRRIGPGAAAFLAALGDGRPLAEAAGAAFASDPGFDLAATLLAVMVDGLAVKLAIDPEP